jgi:hypothetical protein
MTAMQHLREDAVLVFDPESAGHRLCRVADVGTISLVSRAGSRRLPALGIVVGIAGSAALISFVATLVRLPTLLAAVFRFSDAPELSYISQGLATGHGPQLLPTQTSIGVIWFDELIQWLPFRAGVEYWTGPVLTVAMGLLLVRTAQLVLGRKGTLLTSIMLLVLPTVVLWPLLFPDNHITTYAAAVLLGWHLVHDLRHQHSVWRSAIVGVVVGISVVTDPQMLAFGLVPYIATVAVLRPRLIAPQARSFLVTLCGALVAVGLAFVVMNAQGIRTVVILNGSGGLSGVVRGLGLAVQTLVWTIGGGWYGDPVSVVALGLCGATALSLVALVAVGARQRTGPKPGSAPPNTSLAGFGLYWGMNFAFLVGAFVFLGFVGGGAPMQGHYLVGCYFAAAALIPVIAVRYGPRSLTRWRSRAGAAALAAVGVFSLFAVNNAVSTATFDASLFYARLQVPAASDPLPVLLEHGLTHGYAGYWESYDLDWRSNGVLSVWPVVGGAACAGGSGSLCPYAFAPKGEYTPTAGRTFVITPWMGENCGRSSPSEAIFGPPAVVYKRGPYTISVYDYDVASRLSKDASLLC